MNLTPKERGIIMSAPMVRALLEGRKHQTRRICHESLQRFAIAESWDGGFAFAMEKVGNCWHDYGIALCPYGQPGDRLWVRETWQVWTEFNGLAPSDLPNTARSHINYMATGPKWDARVRSPIHMPRWASRITLTLTNVRAERMSAITDADAIACGIEPVCGGWRDYLTGGSLASPVQSQRSLWDSIHGKGEWDKNLWVWVLDFTVDVRGGAA